MENLIDGRAIAGQIHEETRQTIARLLERDLQPGLAFIRVGEDPASRVYVGMKEKECVRLGIRSQTDALPSGTTQKDLLERVFELNADATVHGILVQVPLPPHIDGAAVFNAISPGKDVDGFHPVNMGKLLLGDSDGFVPCTPAGVQELLLHTGTHLAGAEVVVLGRGNIVGKPLSALLSQKTEGANATVTLCHSRTRDIAKHCLRADIIIAAMGKPEFVRADMVKPGATVIDVGVNRVDDPGADSGYCLVGDVDFKNVQTIAGNITPNPGGVGPMTIAMLLRNTVRAASRTIGLKE